MSTLYKSTISIPSADFGGESSLPHISTKLSLGDISNEFLLDEDDGLYINYRVMECAFPYKVIVPAEQSYTAPYGKVEKIEKNYVLIFQTLGSLFYLVSYVNKLRLWKLGDSVCWLSFNMHIGIVAFGGILGEILNLISIIISLFRYTNKPSVKV